jgi:hypothetical protein
MYRAGGPGASGLHRFGRKKASEEMMFFPKKHISYWL